MSNNELIGPPLRGPVVRVTGRGIDVCVRVNGKDDANIVQMAIQMAERRRYGKVEKK